PDLQGSALSGLLEWEWDRPQRRRPLFVREAGDHQVSIDERHVRDRLHPLIAGGRSVGEAHLRMLGVIQTYLRDLSGGIHAKKQRSSIGPASASAGNIDVL